jgi:regulator of replication initiation timing
MVKQAVARTVDLEPIDRLEEKVKLLVTMITQLRAEQAKSSEEHARMAQEISDLRARLADTELASSSELSALREERDVIRTRVTEMLEHLEHLAT